jgi:exodeoxyribonuclease VII small subunit
MTDTQEGFDFEQAFRDLEAIVLRMERGDLGLQASLEAFEQGLALHRACQKALDEAERRVEVLTRAPDGTPRTQPFQPDGD